MLLAGIDIGTLSCRLLVAEVNPPREFKVVDVDRRILRLGEGVDQHKRLSQAAMDRVVATLKAWKERIAKYPLKAMVVVATSAVRESDNRDDFLVRIMQETGWEVEVLTGEEEARRTLLGLRYGLPSAVTDFLGLDIGGRQYRVYPGSRRQGFSRHFIGSGGGALIGAGISPGSPHIPRDKPGGSLY